MGVGTHVLQINENGADHCVHLGEYGNLTREHYLGCRYVRALGTEHPNCGECKRGFRQSNPSNTECTLVTENELTENMQRLLADRRNHVEVKHPDDFHFPGY